MNPLAFPCHTCGGRWLSPTLATQCSRADEAHDEDIRAGVPDPVPAGATEEGP